MPKKGGKKNIPSKAKVAEPKKETEAEQLERLRGVVGTHQKAQAWFYGAVGTLVIVIVAFWGYSMYYKLTNFEFKKTDENKLMAENKQNWKEIFETVAGQDSTAEVKTKLQTILAELKKAAESAPSTPTSTLDTAPATTTTSTINLSTTTNP